MLNVSADRKLIITGQGRFVCMILSQRHSNWPVPLAIIGSHVWQNAKPSTFGVPKFLILGSNERTNFRDAWASLVVLPPTDASAVMVAHRLLSSLRCSSDDNDWPVHSLMMTTVDCSLCMVCGSV